MRNDRTNRTKERTNKRLTRPARWRSVQRVLAVVAVASALCFSMPAAAQAAEEASYRVTVPDLFPERDDLDVGLDIAAAVAWRLAAGTLAPGATLDRELAAVPGPLEVRVQYRLQRACCREQFVQASRELHDLTPLGGLDLDPLELEPGRVLALHLEGALRAALAAQGPGSVAPPSLTWDAWGPRALEVAARSGAAGGEGVAVRSLSTFALQVEATLVDDAGGAPGTWRGEAPADAVLARTFPIAGALEPRKAVPGPEFAVALAAAAAAAALRKTQR